MGRQRDEVAEAIATVAFATLHALMPDVPSVMPAPAAANSSGDE
jgi:hypothetical protein